MIKIYILTLSIFSSIIGICTAQTPPSVFTTKNNDDMFNAYYRFEKISLYPFLTSFQTTWGAYMHDAGFDFDKFGVIDTAEFIIVTTVEHSIPTLQDVYVGSNGVIRCNFLVVSERIKNILEGFTISEHRFYPAKLKLWSDNGEQKVSEGYYLFQVLRQPLKEYHFEECVFKSYSLSETYSVDKSLITYEKGFVNSKNFEQLWAEQVKDYRGLDIDTLVYNKKYNIACDWWGIWFDKAVLDKLIAHKIFEENTIHYFIHDAGHHVGYLSYKDAGISKNNTDTTILFPNKGMIEKRF
jgi:hypothetical protein